MNPVKNGNIEDNYPDEINIKTIKPYWTLDEKILLFLYSCAALSMKTWDYLLG